jgi:hypothetical protein
MSIPELMTLTRKHWSKYLPKKVRELQESDRPDMLHKLIIVCHKCHYNLHDHQQNGAHVKKRYSAPV